MRSGSPSGRTRTRRSPSRCGARRRQRSSARVAVQDSVGAGGGGLGILAEAVLFVCMFYCFACLKHVAWIDGERASELLSKSEKDESEARGARWSPNTNALGTRPSTPPTLVTTVPTGTTMAWTPSSWRYRARLRPPTRYVSGTKGNGTRLSPRRRPNGGTRTSTIAISQTSTAPGLHTHPLRVEVLHALQGQGGPGQRLNARRRRGLHD